MLRGAGPREGGWYEPCGRREDGAGTDRSVGLKVGRCSYTCISDAEPSVVDQGEKRGKGSRKRRT